MKLTIIILTIALLSTIHSYGQRISLSKKDASLETIFNEIHKQADFNFFYNDQWLVGTRKVTIQVKNATIRRVLDICFKGQPLSYSISGKTIVIKQVPVEEEIVTISSDSMAMRAKALEEVTVVSTGYQQLPKERSTGSAVRINNELFNRVPKLNILDHLDGITNGMYFDRRIDGAPRIQIRGLYTLTDAISQPLIVIDNFPYEGDINNMNLNFNDVESVTILKDAAAASIWGARAGNGVIVITTKKGNFNQKPRVSFNSSITVVQKPDIFRISDVSASDYIDVEKLLFDNGRFDGDIVDPFAPITPAVDIFAQQRDGIITDQEATAKLDSLRTLDVRRDYEKYIYRKAIAQQYAVNVGGGGKNDKYFFSLGYDRVLEALRGDDFYRLTLRGDNTFIPFRKLQVHTGVIFMSQFRNNNNIGQYGALEFQGKKLPLSIRLADEEGNPTSVDAFIQGGYTDTIGGGKFLDWKYRPLDEINNSDKITRDNNLLTDIDFKYDLTTAINLELKYRYQNNTVVTDQHYSLQTYFARNLINQFTQIDDEGNLSYLVPLGSMRDKITAKLISHAIRGQIDINKKWGSDHRIDGIIGGELRQGKTEAKNVWTFADTLSDNSVIPVNQVDTGKGNLRYVSIYSNFAYTFKDRYVLSASIRKDASNLFGATTNKRGVPLWSTGVAWRIAKEQFYAIDFLSELTFRATYGFSGNLYSALPAITTISKNPASLQLTNILFSTIDNVPNRDLRWEKIGQFNMGFDFATKNRRVNGTFEYYRKKSTDVISLKEFDPTVGILVLKTNSADIKGHGIDMQVNAIPLTFDNFKWSTSIILNYATYKVSRYQQSGLHNGYYSNGQDILPIVGYNPYLIVSYRWAGLDHFTGDPLGFVNGQPSNDYNAIAATPFADQKISGPAVPKYFGNWLNTIYWKHFSFSANITYKLEYFFRRPTVNYTLLLSNLAVHPDYLKRWQQPEDEKTTNVPSFVYRDILSSSTRDDLYPNSELTVERGDHIRLQDITVGYRLDKKNFSKLPVRQLEFYTYISNLNALLWKANKVGIDPDYITGLVPPLSIVIGVKADF